MPEVTKVGCKPTPGPYEVQCEGDYLYIWSTVVRGAAIARLKRFGQPDNKDMDLSENIAMANASLFAGSHVMLETLKMASKVLNVISEINKEEDCRSFAKANRDEINRIVALVEGGD